MKIGSRADYGLRALLYLARHQKNCGEEARPAQIHAIATQQQVPEDYLRQLLVNLRLAGLVKSVRGPHGGYMLARSREEISMAQVIEVLEGPPEQMRCRHLDEGGPKCEIVGGCEMRAKWRDAKNQMNERMQNTTLGDLVKAEQKQEGECSDSDT